MGDDRPSALPPLGIIQEEEHFLLPNTLYAEPAITQVGPSLEIEEGIDQLIK